MISRGIVIIVLQWDIWAMIVHVQDLGTCRVEGLELLVVRLEKEMSLNGQNYQIHQTSAAGKMQRERKSLSRKKRKRMTDGSMTDYVGLIVNHHIGKDLQNG